MDENTTKDNAVAGRMDMDAIASMLEAHRAALSTDFKSAFSALKSKLDIIQSKVEDQDRQKETSCSVLADANAKLQAKILDLEGRSRRNNIRIIGLPESVEGIRSTEFFAGLLVEVLGDQVFTSPP